jgi:hypothetical protein
MDFLAMHRYVLGGIHAKSDLIAPDTYHGYENLFIDDDLLLLLPAQYKHFVLLVKTAFSFASSSQVVLTVKVHRG